MSPDLEEYFREVRKLWQNELSEFRNEFLEHQEGSREKYAKFYDVRHAEALFSAVPRVIADILVMLMNLRLFPRVHIIEHNDAIHGAGGRPGFDGSLRISRRESTTFTLRKVRSDKLIEEQEIP